MARHYHQEFSIVRIAHINNLAGIASIIATEQNNQGHEAIVLANNPFELSQFGGIRVHNKFLSRHPKWKARVDIKALLGGKTTFLKMLADKQIVHVHGPYPWLLDLLKDVKATKIFHWHGSDLRARGHYAGHCFVSTPDLLQFAPHGMWLPSPIDIHEIEQCIPSIAKSDDKPLNVAHYPYYKQNFRLASHAHVYQGPLKNLERKGKIKVIELLGMTHDEVLRTLSKCDIAIGKIMPDVGWFGKLELEAMALSIPVIAHVSKVLFARYSPPIFNTTVESFEDDLEMLVDHADLRRDLEKNGPEYVKNNHEASKVAQMATSNYALKPINSVTIF